MSPLLILLVFFVYSCGYNIYGVIASDIVAGLRLEAGNAGLLISTYRLISHKPVFDTTIEIRRIVD